LCFHGIFASLIFGFLLAFPILGSRWFRRLLMFCGLAGIFAYFLLYALTSHIKSQAPVSSRVRAEEQAKASEQLQVQAAPRAISEQQTASWPTPIPSPTPAFSSLEKDTIQFDPSQLIPVTGLPSGVAPAAAPVTVQDLSQFLSPKQQQASAPR